MGLSTRKVLGHSFAQDSERKRWYSLREAAAYIGRSEWALRALEKKGKLQAERPDGRLAFDVAVLDQFMKR